MASPAQLAARAKFVAMIHSKSKGGVTQVPQSTMSATKPALPTVSKKAAKGIAKKKRTPASVASHNSVPHAGNTMARFWQP
jgi:hypothetical protein